MTSGDDEQIYYRVGDSPADIAQIKNSQKLKGRAPRNISRSDFPTVQAYVGRLKEGVQGFEFTTSVVPDAGCPPGSANWRACTEKGRTCRKGIELETNGDERAVIEITVGKVQ